MAPLLSWFFISSGLFLGWSLGANHAVNLFGTAVVSKMVKFKVAALIAGVFVVLGSVLSGSGVTKTINELGAVNAIAGSFTVALAVGIAVTWMTRLKLPVSTSQAMVGAIVGWNLFTGHPTDMGALFKIVGTWVTSPLLAAVLGFVLFKLSKMFLLKAKVHMLELDAYTRAGLILVGAFASYTLGANNIANVMGTFIGSVPFNEFSVAGMVTVSGNTQLLFLGGMAIAIGIYTYGHDVMLTVGSDLYKTTPISGLVVVLAESLVLFLFSSQSLEQFLKSMHLPSFPLVPLSSTQAVIGAVIGVGLAKDWRGINVRVLGRIAVGWVIAPLTAGIMAFVALFFMQNVFEQRVIKPVPYEITRTTLELCKQHGIPTEHLVELRGKRYSSTKAFKDAILQHNDFAEPQLAAIYAYAILDTVIIDSAVVRKNAAASRLAQSQIDFIARRHGMVFANQPAFTYWLLNAVEELLPADTAAVAAKVDILKESVRLINVGSK